MHALSVAIITYSPATLANDLQPLRDSYGEVGMLDMPSGHMADDGQLAFVVGDIEQTNRFSLNFQALPWLETSFRYSHFAPGLENFDRSFGFKARLFREEDGLADISVGVRDLLGTGIYSSEYVAASKRIGALDFTGGVGWGRLADSHTFPNPFGVIVPSFDVRGAQTSSGTGGDFNIKQYFRGPKVGLFGGVAWRTPIDGLTFLAEYSSDKYTREKLEAPKTFPVRSPVNLGFSYQVSDNISASAGWYYGSSYGFTISLSGNPKSETGSSARISAPLPDASPRTDAQKQQALTLLISRNSKSGIWMPANETERAQLNLNQALLSEGRGVREANLQQVTLVVDARLANNASSQCVGYARIAAGTRAKVRDIALIDLEGGDGQVTFCPVGKTVTNNFAKQAGFERTLRDAMRRQNLTLDAVSYDASEMSVYYENGHYNSEDDALGRMIRLLSYYADPSVELFHLYPIVAGQPTQKITVIRSGIERAMQNAPEGASVALGRAVSIDAAPLNNPALTQAISKNYPRFSWWIGPRIGEQLFDPDKPLQLMLLGEVDAGLALNPNLTVGTTLTSTLWTNYTFTRPAGSLLPHVRTDLLKYLDKGATGISYLGADYVTRLAPDLFAETRGGYLEDMFMGAGGQLLWRPEGSRFAVGADLYQVWQRDFDRLFGVQKYNVLTGHVSVYYSSPWHDLNFAVHAGRYLAGDYGATFEITRRFRTGVEIGAFATLTNVPFSRFGEGSFDKGIIIRIPLEWGLPVYSQTSYDVDLRSLTRDGGQRLANDDSLYDMTMRTSYGEITSHSDQLVAP